MEFHPPDYCAQQRLTSLPDIIDYDVALYTQFMSSVLKYTPRSHQKAQSSIVGPCVRNVLGKCRFGNNCNRNRASESVIFFYIRCTNNNKDIPWGNCEHVEANVEIDKLPQACGPFSIGGDCTHDCVGAVPAPLEPDTRLMHLPQLWRNYALIAVNDIRLFKGTQQGYHAWWMEFAPMLKRFGLIPVAENII